MILMEIKADEPSAELYEDFDAIVEHMLEESILTEDQLNTLKEYNEVKTPNVKITIYRDYQPRRAEWKIKQSM